jgi:hypothetical protein
VALALALASGCGPDATGGLSERDLVARFEQLHRRVYDVYEIGPERERLHALLASVFDGRALTEEYVEHYTTAVRMRDERTSIDVVRIDYDGIEVLSRTRESARVGVAWSVGSVIGHRDHRHARVNRYRAVYTLADVAGELRIVGTRLGSLERVGSLSDLDPASALDGLPETAGGTMDPLELLRSGVGGGGDEAPE